MFDKNGVQKANRPGPAAAAKAIRREEKHRRISPIHSFANSEGVEQKALS
jgi:hypothetical protein